MPDTIKIKGRFSVPGSLPDAFGLPYAGAFLFGEDGTIGSLSAASAPAYGQHSSIISCATHSGERHKSIDVPYVARSPNQLKIKGFYGKGCEG